MALIPFFLIVFGLNILPGFAPPTWMVLSALGFLDPQIGAWRVAVTAALAATLGRAVLAKIATLLVRRRWLSVQTQANIDIVIGHLAARPKTTVGVFLAYAFSPFPSNSLFLAYGLTGLPPRLQRVFRRPVGDLYLLGPHRRRCRASCHSRSIVGRRLFRIYFVLTHNCSCSASSISLPRLIGRPGSRRNGLDSCAA